MTGGEISIFNSKIAGVYESWYETKKGRYCDKLEKNLILNMLNPKSGESLLDIGCGTGHHLRWLKNFGLKLYGIDNSKAMLDTTRNNLDREIQLKLGRAEHLPYRDNEFDIATLITSLEFFEHPEGALREALRVSKNKVFLGVLNKFSFFSLKRRLKGIFLKDLIWKHVKFYSIWQLLKLARDVGVNLKLDWQSCIPNRSGKNPFGVFLGVLIAK